MKTIHQWFEEYGVSHQHPVNKLIHWVAVPVIYFSVFGLLWQIPMPYALFAEQQITWSLLLAMPVLAFYFSLSFVMGLCMTLLTTVVVLLIRYYQQHVSVDVWQLSLLLFILMWVLQFIGHKIEGKKPSFFEDVQFLLIGPAWLIGFILRKLKIRY